MNNNNNRNIDKTTTQLEQTLLHRVEELEQINSRLQSDIEARELAQEGLRYGQKFLREVISSVDDSFFTVFDQNCLINFVWGSKKLEEKYGIIFQDYMGKDSNIISPILGIEIRHVFETNQSFHGEWSDDRQGNIVWWDFTLSPIRDEDNEMVAVVAAARDITESKKKEEKLRLNSQIMTNLSEGVYLIRLEDGIIVYTNPTFEEMFGYNPGEMIGKNVEIVNAPTDQSPAETKLNITQILLDTGEWHGEVLNIKKNGTHFWCYANVSLFDHPEYGRVIVSVHTDITERKEINEYLKENVLMLQKTQEIGQIGSFEMDLATGDVVWSDQLYKLFGLEKEGRLLDFEKVMALIHPDDRERAMKVSSDAAKERKAYTLEHRVIHPDGKILDLLITGDIIYNEKNVAVKIGGTTQNITERKKIENMLRESEEKFSKTFSNAPIMLTISTVKDGKFIDVNTSFLDKLGYKREEILGMTTNDLNLFVNYEEREKIIQLTKDNGYVRNFEMKARCKTGEILDGLFSAEVVHLLDGDYLVTTMSDVTESKKIAEKLRISEERYRIIAENANENIWSYDLNLNLTYTSRTGKRVLGYTPDEYKIMKISDYTLPDSYEILVNDLTSELENDKINRDIHRVRKFDNIKQRHKEGHIVISELIVTFLRDADGNPAGILGMSRNVTERKKSEELLKKSEEKYRNLVFNLVDILLEIDMNGIVTYVSPQCYNILGYQPSELIGKNTFDFIHPEDIPKVIESMGKAINAVDTVFNLEYRLLHKNGNIVHIIATGKHVISDGNGKLTGIMRDISKNRKAEQKLKESEEKLKDLLEAVPIGIVTTSLEGRLLECNTHLIELLGYDSKEEFLKTPILEHYYNPKDREKFLELHKKNKVKDFEVHLRRTNGTIFWASITSVSKTIGKQTTYINILQDITESKEEERKLRESEHNLGERVKEITCLYNISDLLEHTDASIEEIITDVLNYIPPAWQFPELTCSRIFIGEQEFKTANFRKTDWMQNVDIVVDGKKHGKIEVYYLEEVLDYDEGPFLKEERNLIHSIASILGRFINRQHINDQIIESEARLKYYVSSSPAIIYTSTTDGNFGATFISENVKKLTGYSQEDFINNSDLFAENIHPDDKDSVFRELEGIFDKGSLIYNYRFRFKDGTYHWMRDESILIKDEFGNHIELIGTWMDISKSKEFEQNLKESRKKRKIIKESEEFLRKILNNIKTGVWVVNKEDNFTYWNDSMEKISGLQRDQVLGHNLIADIPEKTMKGETDFEKLFLDTKNTLKPTHYEKLLIITPMGRKSYQSGVIIPLTDENGKYNGAICTVEDITEYEFLKEMEEKIRKSKEKYQNLFNKAHVGIFSSRVSDGKCMECNEYLASIMGYDSIEEVLEDYIGIEHYVKVEDREKILEMVQKNGFIEDHEVEVTKKDGTPYGRIILCT